MVPASSVPCICHFYVHWRAKCAKDSQAHPLPYGLSSSSLPCSARFLHDKPFFSSTGVLMNFHCSGCQASALFHLPGPAQLRLGGSVPIHRLLSMSETYCIHFATAQTALVNLARGLLYWASIESRWAFLCCFFRADLLVASFISEINPLFYSFVSHWFHIVSYYLFYHFGSLYTIPGF